jgi:hypothetical protein
VRLAQNVPIQNSKSDLYLYRADGTTVDLRLIQMAAVVEWNLKSFIRIDDEQTIEN